MSIWIVYKNKFEEKKATFVAHMKVKLGKTEIIIKFSNPSFLRVGMEFSVVFSCSEEDKK